VTHDAAPDATPDRTADALDTWRPRPPADDALAYDPSDPSDEDLRTLDSLLGQIGELRLSLAADMGLLASAVELEAYDIATEVVDGERDDLAAFAGRTTATLAAAAATGPAARRPWTRSLRAAVPLTPALAAAAALIGVLAGVVPTPVVPPSDRTPATSAAASSYAELHRLQAHGASARALRQAAHGLHAEVARVMALAGEDPAAAEVALRLLAREVTGLDDDEQRADLRSVLAESQRLIAALQSAVTGVRAGLPAPEAVGIAVPVRDVAATPLPAPSAPGAVSDASTDSQSAETAGTTSPTTKPESSPSATPTAGTPSPTPSPGLLPKAPSNSSTSLLPKGEG
jgi:hypothetical protein